MLSSLIIILVPGPDLILVTRLVIQHERAWPAFSAAAGMISAGAIQLLFGLSGVALLLRANPLFFTLLRWAGAVVLLIWAVLALRSALRKLPVVAAGAVAGRSSRNTYLQGLLCTGSNPKVGLFLMAFLPQFVPKNARQVPALLFLGGVYLAMGLVWLVIWISVAHQLRRRTLISPHVTRAAEFLLSIVFVYFAIRLYRYN